MNQQQQAQQGASYSPVDRAAQRHKRAGSYRRQGRPKPLVGVTDGATGELTSPKLRYLDDEESADERNDLDDGLAARSRVFFEKCGQSNREAPATSRLHQSEPEPMRSKHKLGLGRTLASKKQEPSQTQKREEDELARRAQDETEEENVQEREEIAASLEEVYLCNCCGVTRPLDPAMKYMPLFRGTFLLFNFLVFAFGFANLSMGLWFRIDPKVYEIHKYIETQNFTYAGWIMLFGGFLACMMALAGFAAASRQSICMLISYAITMTLLTVAFIGSLVLLTVYGLGAHLERFMNKEIYEQIRRRTMSTEVDLMSPSESDSAQFLDFVQVKLRCCGAQDFRDYQKLGMIIPTTCYTIAGNYINAPGCGQALRELFDLRAGLAAGTTAASVVAQILATILASLMVCSIYNWRASPRPASALSTYAASNSSSSAGGVAQRPAGSPQHQRREGHYLKRATSSSMMNRSPDLVPHHLQQLAV